MTPFAICTHSYSIWHYVEMRDIFNGFIRLCSKQLNSIQSHVERTLAAFKYFNQQYAQCSNMPIAWYDI